MSCTCRLCGPVRRLRRPSRRWQRTSPCAGVYGRAPAGRRRETAGAEATSPDDIDLWRWEAPSGSLMVRLNGACSERSGTGGAAEPRANQIVGAAAAEVRSDSRKASAARRLSRPGGGWFSALEPGLAFVRPVTWELQR